MKKTKKPFSMKKWVKSRNGQQTIVILSFMIIPLLLLFVFTYLPFGEMVKFSFYKMKYATPVDKRQFVGFRNYIDVFKKDECFSALKLSLYYMAGAMVQLKCDVPYKVNKDVLIFPKGYSLSKLDEQFIAELERVKEKIKMDGLY